MSIDMLFVMNEELRTTPTLKGLKTNYISLL